MNKTSKLALGTALLLLQQGASLKLLQATMPTACACLPRSRR